MINTKRNKTEKLRVFFLGLLFSDKTMKEAQEKSKVGIQMAPHIFQTNLLKGFKEIDNVDISVINTPPIGSFPVHYKRMIMHAEKWNNNYRQIGYVNLPFLKHGMQQKEIERLLEEQIDDTNRQVIFIYTMYPPFVKAAHSIKERHPNIHVSLLQTDPVLGKDGIYRKNSKGNIKKGKKLISLMKNYDSFVALTKPLAEAMEIREKPFLVLDCIIDDSYDIGSITYKPNQKRRFLYTGSTRETNGVKTLVDSFSLLPEAELWICGGGDSDDYIREKEEKSDNIKFYGMVRHDKIKEIQSQCDFMINPRRPSGDFTKFSFPSKTAEYLMTGKPTVMYHLEGLSEEYNDFLNYIYADNAIDLADELRIMIETDYSLLLKKAEQAKVYMLREKSPKRQIERIIKMWELH